MLKSITRGEWNIIHRVLLDDWDPIGVKQFHNASETDDEYDHYIGELYSILKADNAFKNTVSYLWYLENEHIGLPGNMDHTRRVAALLVDKINHG